MDKKRKTLRLISAIHCRKVNCSARRCVSPCVQRFIAQLQPNAMSVACPAVALRYVPNKKKTAMLKIEKLLYTAKTHTTGGCDGASGTSDGRLDVKLSTPGTSGTGT